MSYRARCATDTSDEPLGYDFSQGYTSLERDADTRESEPGFMRRWLEKRREEKSKNQLLDAIEALAGKKFPDIVRRKLAHGPNEEDLVNSGLEETMSDAFQEIYTVKQEKGIPDFRTASYVVAINKVAVSYLELGVFP